MEPVDTVCSIPARFCSVSIKSFWHQHLKWKWNECEDEVDGWMEWRVCRWSPDADDKIIRCYEDLKCNNQMNDNLEINLMQD